MVSRAALVSANSRAEVFLARDSDLYFDQFFGAIFCASKRAVLTAQPILDPPKLRSAVLQLLSDDQARDRAQALARSISAYSPAQRLATQN